MKRSRWLAEWRNSVSKPVFYHCISRVVDRRFVMGAREKERFRMLMRMTERFSGCRVVAYCLMDNHFHLLLEVPPMAAGGLTDRDLLQRLSALYPESRVAEVAGDLQDARQRGLDKRVAEIHGRFTYRMHDLSEFMKTLVQRYTRWHNRIHERTGRLWEDRFKSVIVEDGVAARTIAAYIDLNPVRAGIVTEPADYRWSSYGEAIGGGMKGNGKTARAGLVRAWGAHQGMAADAGLWLEGGVSRGYRKMLLSGALERVSESVGRDGATVRKTVRRGMSQAEAAAGQDGMLPPGVMLRCRIRYFTEGAVIGSRLFVNEAFACARERFGLRRKDGARAMRGVAAAARGLLWSMRDLRKGV
jgi:REP element-mobilizing transposase RayT